MAFTLRLASAGPRLIMDTVEHEYLNKPEVADGWVIWEDGYEDKDKK